jgi:hypothetical protein
MVTLEIKSNGNPVGTISIINTGLPLSENKEIFAYNMEYYRFNQEVIKKNLIHDRAEGAEALFEKALNEIVKHLKKLGRKKRSRNSN